jgi:hypothetical protein
MRYRLRTLLIALALGPLVLWIAWLVALHFQRAPGSDYRVPAGRGLRVQVPMLEPPCSDSRSAMCSG